MPNVEIRIPQLGEGLQEARLIRFIKQPGDNVSRDEALFEMETDKAVMEIESPADGVVGAWAANEGDVLPIGAVIGSVSTGPADDGVGEARRADHPAAASPENPRAASPEGDREEHGPTAPASPVATSEVPRVGQVPPRTRAYARERDVSEEDLAALAAETSGKIMPADVDRFLAARASVSAASTRRAPASSGYRDVRLTPAQRTFVFRLERGTKDVIPASMAMPVGWEAIEEVRQRLRKNGGQQPSQSLLFTWCVAQSITRHPKFRSMVVGEGIVRQYDVVNLGVAVARPNDELVMARVDSADALSFNEFSVAYFDAVRRAKDGQDQATDTMQFSVTNMASQGVRLGIPVLVAPASGTLFVGEPFDEALPVPGGGVRFRRTASMVLTFDHRIANGAAAAALLSDIRRRVESLSSEFAALAPRGESADT